MPATRLSSGGRSETSKVDRIKTQLTDVESEWNGLMTYDRVLKCGHEVRDRVVPAIVDVRTRLSALE